MFKTSEKSLVTNINNIVASLFVINLFGVMVFMRSFVGIYIFGIQLGKIYTGLSLLVCLLLSSKKSIPPLVFKMPFSRAFFMSSAVSIVT